MAKRSTTDGAEKRKGGESSHSSADLDRLVDWLADVIADCRPHRPVSGDQVFAALSAKGSLDLFGHDLYYRPRPISLAEVPW